MFVCCCQSSQHSHQELREGWQRQREILANENPDWSSEESDDGEEQEEGDGPVVDAEAAQMERELEAMLVGAELEAEEQELEGLSRTLLLLSSFSPRTHADMIAAETGAPAKDPSASVTKGRPLPFVKKVGALTFVAFSC